MSAPSALAIDANGVIQVADTGNGRVARFTTGGTYLGSTALDDDPRGIAVTPDGTRTYVADARNRITVLDSGGAQLAQFGGTGSKLGKLNAPGQMTVDGAGNLWVADRGNNRVQAFGPDGARLLAFGTRGSGPGQFVHPTGVAVDCRGLLTVTDAQNNRVQQFGLAAPPPATCAALGPLGTPPAPKVPTLPAPDGPQLSVRVLRAGGLLRTRSLPVRAGCDTTCSLEATAVIAPRARPPKGHRAVRVSLKAPAASVPAGQTKVVRFAISRRDAARMSRALRGRRGLAVTLQLTATASAGDPTSVTQRLNATR